MASTVRVDRRTHQALRALARETGQPMTEVLAMAVEEYRRKLFWEEARASVERLKADPGAWADYRRESRELEGFDNPLNDDP
jgi:predicted transcriptional regulator